VGREIDFPSCTTAHTSATRLGEGLRKAETARLRTTDVRETGFVCTLQGRVL